MGAFEQACRVEAEGVDDLVRFLGQQGDDGRFVLTNKGRLATDLQLAYGDAFVSRDGNFYACEFKVERRFTGNFFIETWSNRSRFRRGWLDHLDADLLLYYFTDSCELFVIPFPRLKRWAFGGDSPNERLHDYRHVCQHKYEQKNDTWGRLVPVAVIHASDVGFRYWRKDASGEFVREDYVPSFRSGQGRLFA